MRCEEEEGSRARLRSGISPGAGGQKLKNIFGWSHESQKACASAGFWAVEAKEKLEGLLAGGCDPKTESVIEEALELLFAIESNADRAKLLSEKINHAACKQAPGPAVSFKPALELVNPVK